MKLSIRKLAASVVLALAMPLCSYADVVILHTNDTHCGIDRNLGFAKVAEYKKEMAKDHGAVILADAGDAIQGEPVGKLSQGASIISILNAVGYDFAIPGNHEFDYGMERFLALAPTLQCGYYSSNFTDLRTGKLVLPPYKLFTLDGKKIALVGVTTPESLVSSTPAYFKDKAGTWIYGFAEDEKGDALYGAVQKAVDSARKEGAEYVILVGHLGTNGSIDVWSSGAVIAHTSGIDAVIDGHSHEVYSKVLTNKDGKPVVLAQTGTKLETLGKLTISDAGEITSELVKEISAADPKVEALVKKENEAVEKELSQKVGTATIHFVTDIDGVRRVRSGETNLGDFAADAIRETFHTDVAILNGGALRGDILPGDLTYKTLMTVYPFGNMMAVYQVTGQQILDALEVGAMNCPEENGGFLQVSGMTYDIHTGIKSGVKLDEKGDFLGIEGERRVANVYIGGEPLDPMEDYTVAGNAYLLKYGGNSMTMFQSGYLLQDTDVADIETLVNFVKAKGGIVGEGYENPEGEGRIRIISVTE